MSLFEARGLTAVNRASLHYYNSEEELTRLVDAVVTAPRAIPPPGITPASASGTGSTSRCRCWEATTATDCWSAGTTDRVTIASGPTSSPGC